MSEPTGLWDEIEDDVSREAARRIRDRRIRQQFDRWRCRRPWRWLSDTLQWWLYRRIGATEIEVPTSDEVQDRRERARQARALRMEERHA